MTNMDSSIDQWMTVGRVGCRIETNIIYTYTSNISKEKKSSVLYYLIRLIK